MRTVLSIIMIMLVFSCNRKPKNSDPPLAPTEIRTDTVVADEIPQANNSLKYLGTYKGKLPCKDCSGVQVSLELSEDFSYRLISVHMGKNSVPVEQNGSYSWNKSETAIILDNIKESANQYLVGENSLTQLDINGQQNTNSSRYILTKVAEVEGQKPEIPSSK